jgi:hypothetical protein
VCKPKKEAQCYTQAEKAVKKTRIEDCGWKIIFHLPSSIFHSPFSILHFSLSLPEFESPITANEKCNMESGK